MSSVNRAQVSGGGLAGHGCSEASSTTNKSFVASVCEKF